MGGPDSYTNQLQFYKDMKIMWKKRRNFKYFNRIITKPVNKGFKTFNKEWDRLFVKKKPLEHKIPSNKISDNSRIKKKHKRKLRQRPKKKKARNRKIIYHNSSHKYKKIKRSAHESKKKKKKNSRRKKKKKKKKKKK